MSCGKCGWKKLCPVSLGLALGVVGALSVLIWSGYVMYHGLTPMMIEHHIPMPTWSGSGVHALWVLGKGFLLGFFIALFYDFFSCCMRKCRCKSTCNCGGNCSCSCCSKENKPEVRNDINMNR